MKPLQLVKGTLITVLIMAASPCSATIYKCVDSDGNTSIQEQPCPSDNTSDEVKVHGSAMSLSPEDQAWVSERKPVMELACIEEFKNNQNTRQVFSPEVGKQMCQCGIKKYFSNPISKLRALEKNEDLDGSKSLMTYAMTACAKEIVDKRR